MNEGEIELDADEGLDEKKLMTESTGDASGDRLS